MNTEFDQLVANTEFDQLVVNTEFGQLVVNTEFDQLVVNTEFYQLVVNTEFDQLVANTEFYPLVTRFLYEIECIAPACLAEWSFTINVTKTEHTSVGRHMNRIVEEWRMTRKLLGEVEDVARQKQLANVAFP